jgi:hypothetical protein
MKISAATLQTATKLDDQLQTYLDAYLARKPDADEPAEDADDIHNIEGLDTPAKDVEIEDIDEPVTLGDGTPVAGNEAEEPSEPQKPAPKSQSNKGDESINLHDVEF